jgi:hypothetical protein
MAKKKKPCKRPNVSAPTTPQSRMQVGGHCCFGCPFRFPAVSFLNLTEWPSRRTRSITEHFRFVAGAGRCPGRVGVADLTGKTNNQAFCFCWPPPRASHDSSSGSDKLRGPGDGDRSNPDAQAILPSKGRRKKQAAESGQSNPASAFATGAWLLVCFFSQRNQDQRNICRPRCDGCDGLLVCCLFPSESSQPFPFQGLSVCVCESAKCGHPLVGSVGQQNLWPWARFRVEARKAGIDLGDLARRQDG